VKNKFHIIVAIVLVVLIVSGGIYAYTYTTALAPINITDPTGNIATVNATPTQPDWNDVLTPVSDTETFRPHEAGDETKIEDQEPDSGEHWAKVDEVTSDGDNTYVYTEDKKWQEDLYRIPDHSTQTAAGDIDNVEVYMVSKGTSVDQTNAYAHIKTGGSEYNGTEETLTTSYATYSYQWDTNPQTTVAWAWDDIDALQIGIGLRQAEKGEGTRCTQVYAEVDFDAPPLTGNTPLGDLFEIIEHPDYDGDLSVKVYLTNTGNLTKAYRYLNMELYLEDSVEAGQTPNYRVLSLLNGVATFSLENPVSDNHTLSVTGGGYALKSREPDDWEEGYTVTPELYCEVTQR